MRSCSILFVTARDDDSEKAYREFLEKLRDMFHLQKLRLGSLKDTDDSVFQFPDIDNTRVSEEPNEDGYLVVDVDTINNSRGIMRYRMVCQIC
jgi:hypothetical protein